MKSWSFSLGSFAGTEVRVHVTFVLLVAWFAIIAGAQAGTAAAIEAVLFIIAVFACVVAHEFGHALTARRYGIKTRDITLLPIGGVASLERMPEKPAQEILVAIAGPAVNVVIAVVLFAVFGASINVPTDPTTNVLQLDFLTRLALINVMLVVFNMIPAFPMDGGRVLRAALAFQFKRAVATRIAAKIGQAVAFALGFIGLFGNPLLVFIALFIFLAASHEAYAVELEEATKGAQMRDATITTFSKLDVGASVGKAVEVLLSTEQREFPVVDGMDRLRGVLMRDGIIRALASSGPETPVLDVMERDVATLNARAPLADAATALQTSGKSVVGIIDDDERIIGIVTLENLAEYMMVTQAQEGWGLKSGQSPAGA